MRAFLLVAGAALALSACGGGGSEANEVDTLAVNNLVVDENVAGMPMDNGMVGMDANMMMNTTDPATQNAMMQDMNTNAPDTNLANGL